MSATRPPVTPGEGEVGTSSQNDRPASTGPTRPSVMGSERALISEPDARRRHQVLVRLTADEYDDIAARADLNRCSIPEYLRRAATAVALIEAAQEVQHGCA